MTCPSPPVPLHAAEPPPPAPAPAPSPTDPFVPDRDDYDKRNDTPPQRRQF